MFFILSKIFFYYKKIKEEFLKQVKNFNKLASQDKYKFGKNNFLNH